MGYPVDGKCRWCGGWDTTWHRCWKCPGPEGKFEELRRLWVTEEMRKEMVKEESKCVSEELKSTDEEAKTEKENEKKESKGENAKKRRRGKDRKKLSGDQLRERTWICGKKENGRTSDGNETCQQLLKAMPAMRLVKGF